MNFGEEVRSLMIMMMRMMMLVIMLMILMMRMTMIGHRIINVDVEGFFKCCDYNFLKGDGNTADQGA